MITSIIKKLLRVDIKEEKITVMRNHLNAVAYETERKWTQVNKIIKNGVTFDIAKATGAKIK